MTLAQVSDVVFLFLLPVMLKTLGYKRTIVIGILAWVPRYFLLARQRAMPPALQTPLIFAAILLHGVCYDFLFIAGQLYVDDEANERIRGAAQGFIAFILWGVGAFVGTMLAGRVLAAHQVAGGPGQPVTYDWQAIWSLPAWGAVAVLALFVLVFRNPARVAQAPFWRGGRLERHHRVVVRLHRRVIDRRCRRAATLPSGQCTSRLPGVIGAAFRRPRYEPAAARSATAVPSASASRVEISATDQDVVAAGARERIDLTLDHRVELLAAPRRDTERAGRVDRALERHDRGVRRPHGIDRREMRLAVGRREVAVGIERRAAPLELIALGCEPFDACVERDRRERSRRGSPRRSSKRTWCARSGKARAIASPNTCHSGRAEPMRRPAISGER